MLSSASHTLSWAFSPTDRALPCCILTLNLTIINRMFDYLLRIYNYLNIKKTSTAIIKYIKIPNKHNLNKWLALNKTFINIIKFVNQQTKQ